MKFDIYDYLSDFVDNHGMNDGDEIFITIQGKSICRTTVLMDEQFIEFKIKF